VRFGDEVRDFAINVGNFSVGSFEVELTGSVTSGVESSCAINTLQYRPYQPDMPQELIVLCEGAIDVYCAVAGSNEVRCYDQNFVESGEEMDTWPSFNEWILWLIDYAIQTRKNAVAFGI
jgi:hypothetical protein